MRQARRQLPLNRGPRNGYRLLALSEPGPEQSIGQRDVSEQLNFSKQFISSMVDGWSRRCSKFRFPLSERGHDV